MAKVNQPGKQTHVAIGQTLTTQAQVRSNYNKTPVEVIIDWLDASRDCKDVRRMIHGTFNMVYLMEAHLN